MAKQPEDNKTRDLYRSARGAYFTGAYYGAGSGAFIYSLRQKRRMTQAQYAAFLGCSLRTLVTEEKSQHTYPPYHASAVGAGLAAKEFKNQYEMVDAFRAFVKAKTK